MGRIIQAIGANRRDAQNQRAINRMRRNIRSRIKRERREARLDSLEPYLSRWIVLGGLVGFWLIIFSFWP